MDLPEHTRNNGSLYMHCFLLPIEYHGVNPFRVSLNSYIRNLLFVASITFVIFGESNETTLVLICK